MASRLGQHFLRAKSKAENFGLFALYSFYFFICCLAAQWPIFDCYWGNSLTHPILLTAFGLPIFVPRVTGRGWGSTPNWVPSELWSQCLNPFSHTYKLQKILSADLHPVFIKCVNAQNTQKIIAWHCGGLSACKMPYWMLNLELKTLAFSEKSIQ